MTSLSPPLSSSLRAHGRALEHPSSLRRCTAALAALLPSCCCRLLRHGPAMSPPRTPLQATRAGQALGDAHSTPPATNAERRGQHACPGLQCRAYAVADAELSEQAAPDARRTTHRCCHQPHARLRPSPGCCPPARAARPPQHHLPSLVRLFEAELGPCTRAPRAAAAIVAAEHGLAAEHPPPPFLAPKRPRS